MQASRKICIILNESSGDHPEGKDRRARLEEALDRHGLEYDILTPEPGTDIHAYTQRVIRRGNCGMIVAAGGDGTIAGVAGATHDAGLPMGVIPQGTFNYFARGLGIPEDMDAAVKALSIGNLRDVSLGEVNGKVFLNNTSLGIYPLILRRRESIYRRWGRSRLAAYWSVLLTLIGFRRPLKLKVRLDGREMRLKTPLAFVANSSYQLEEFNLDGADTVRSGKLALFTSRGKGRLGLVNAALRLAHGSAQKGEEFSLHTGRDLSIETGRKRALVARDGEKELMHTPIRIRLRDQPLRVVAPVQDAATSGSGEQSHPVPGDQSPNKLEHGAA